MAVLCSAGRTEPRVDHHIDHRGPSFQASLAGTSPLVGLFALAALCELTRISMLAYKPPDGRTDDQLECRANGYERQEQQQSAQQDRRSELNHILSVVLLVGILELVYDSLLRVHQSRDYALMQVAARCQQARMAEGRTRKDSRDGADLKLCASTVRGSAPLG
jgi:hypothetical protein